MPAPGSVEPCLNQVVRFICLRKPGLCEGKSCKHRRAELLAKFAVLEALHGINTDAEEAEYQALKKELGKE